MKVRKKPKLPTPIEIRRLAELANVPASHHLKFQGWVHATLSRHQFVIEFYNGLMTRKERKADVEKLAAAAEVVRRAPQWLPGAMVGWEQLALSERHMRGQRLNRAFLAAERRVKGELLAIGRLANRLEKMRIALDTQPADEFEILAQRTAEKPENAWLARSIVRMWRKYHTDTPPTAATTSGLNRFARALWQLADGLKYEPSPNTVRARLRVAIATFERPAPHPLPSRHPDPPANRKQWRAAYADGLISLGMDPDSAVEMAARRSFTMTDDPLLMADSDFSHVTDDNA